PSARAWLKPSAARKRSKASSRSRRRPVARSRAHTASPSRPTVGGTEVAVLIAWQACRMAPDHPSVVLIRHGETAWSRSGQHTSTTDVPLTEEGRRRARALGERLAGRSFALVLTSPMSRARETAALAGLGEKAEVTEDLHEVAYGSYEGRTTPEIREE